MPAYLPHVMPKISSESAKNACRVSGKAFVRWADGYDSLASGEWWYVVREGTYTTTDCSANTRSKISRGKKKLHARVLTVDEVIRSGYEVCKLAIGRFGDEEFLPVQEKFNLSALMAKEYPDIREYCGVFSGDDLVGFSENIIQDGAVFWETIWYDPGHLKNYSSYVLTDFMLDYYLNEKSFSYVSDGSRSIYHSTNVQEFFIEKFSFTKKFARLHVVYNRKMAIVVGCIFHFRRFIPTTSGARVPRMLKRVQGIISQERIRRACESQVC